jgi:hypothetical protein
VKSISGVARINEGVIELKMSSGNREESGNTADGQNGGGSPGSHFMKHGGAMVTKALQSA